MITDPHAAFLLGVTITGAAFLVLGYWLIREHRSDMADLCAAHKIEVTNVREAHKATAVIGWETAVKLERTETELAKAKDDLGWERLWIAVVESDRDMYATAPRGLLTHQAKSELTQPDAPAGVADVYEFPAGGRG